MKIADYLLQTLEQNGVTHIFGNPGTTELPLVKACEQRGKLKYVVALSEVSAVPMADGYARATRSLGVVNLHVAPGLGNGMGTLYTAGIAGTPLLVLVGGQDRRFLHTNPILWGPVEKMAGAVCKAVFMLNTTFDAAGNIRRALRAALTPPYGPVALICPPDLLETDIDAKPASVTPATLAALDKAQVAAYAKFLSSAKNPAIIAAEDVHWDNASGELEKLAAALGAPVYAAPYTGVLPVSSTSKVYAGYLPPSLKQVADRLAAHDALLCVGGRGLRNTLYAEASLPQKKAWLGHESSAQAPGGDEGEYTLATVTNLKPSLAAITAAMRKRPPSGKPARAALDLPARNALVLHPTLAIHALLKKYANAIWVDESGLSTSDVRQWMNLKAGDYLINGSGGIGWGLAGSVGAAIAQLSNKNARQVVAVIGDGSALYASEALWTASHHGTKILLVILSNRRYATLNAAATRLAGGPLKSFTIEPPVIDFSGLAKLYDWRYMPVSSEAQMGAALTKLGNPLKQNTLLEIHLDPDVQPVTASRHF